MRGSTRCSVRLRLDGKEDQFERRQKFDSADDFSERLAKITNRQYGFGFIDKQGKTVIERQFGCASRFSGGAGVCKG
jgi:WG containing repeat